MIHLIPTNKFSIFSIINNTNIEEELKINHWNINIHKHILLYIDINCNYCNVLIKKAYNKRQLYCHIITTLDDTISDLISKYSHQFHIDIVQIGDFENIVWDNVLAGKHFASSYIVRKGLSRKAQLCQQIRKYISKHPNTILKASIPFSLVIQTWDAFDNNIRFDFGNSTFATFDLSSHAIQLSIRQRLELTLEDICYEVNREDRIDWIWILKPSVTNKGLNIVLAKSWNEILDSLEYYEDIREWVLQRYIPKPLLINQHKFHLRVYVLCIGSLQVYVFNHILMLLAGKQYCDNLNEIHAHLTNTARAIELEDFQEEKFVKLLEDLPEFLLKEYSSIVSNEQQAKDIKEDILNNIYKITHDVFEAYENEYTIFSPMSNCFELFGLDFIVNEEFQVFFLEANPGPDFKQTGSRLQQVIEDLWEQTFQLTIDTYAESSSNDTSVAKDFKKVYDKQWSSSQFKGGMTLS